MRKQYKRKRRSCALCRPQKMGWAKRWKPKDRAKIAEAEREIQSSLPESSLSGQGVPLGVKGLYPSLKRHWVVCFVVENQELSERHRIRYGVPGIAELPELPKS